MRGGESHRRGVPVLQKRRIPPHHPFSGQRRAHGPARPLYLPAGRRHRRILVRVLAARGQTPGQGPIHLPSRSFLHEVRMRVQRHQGRADLIHPPGRGGGGVGPVPGKHGEPAAQHQRVQLCRAVLPPYRHGQPQFPDEPVRRRLQLRGRHHRAGPVLRGGGLPVFCRHLRPGHLRRLPRRLHRPLPHGIEPPGCGKGGAVWQYRAGRQPVLRPA